MTYVLKKIDFVIAVFLSAFFLSCNTSKTKNEKECLPGHVFLCYLGDSNHPKSTTFWRTYVKDTSYMQYSIDSINDLRLSREHLIDYCLYIKIDNDEYFKIKEFVISNDTHNTSIADINGSRINSTRIFIQDKCDTVSYIVKKSDSNYFAKLIKELKKSKNKELLSKLRYYKYIQERRSESDYYKK